MNTKKGEGCIEVWQKLFIEVVHCGNSQKVLSCHVRSLCTLRGHVQHVRYAVRLDAHRNDRVSKYIEIGFRIDVYCFTEVMTLGKEYSIRGIVFMSFAQGLDRMPLMA